MKGLPQRRKGAKKAFEIAFALLRETSFERRFWNLPPPLCVNLHGTRIRPQESRRNSEKFK
jgi:hypothetical protein